MLDDQWLVQVLVKDSEGFWCIGTGYPIGNGLVLTANHVVSIARTVDPQFTLVWHQQSYHETPFTNEDIVFQDEQLDLAVIHYKEATSFKPPEITLATTELKTNQSCSTRGFPRAGKLGEVSHQEKASEVGKKRDSIGSVLCVQGIKASGVIELNTNLTVKSEQIKEDDKVWSGLSGSPVFIDKKLVAIITHEYKTIEGFFLATPIYGLKDKEKFHEAIKQHIAEAKDKAKEELQCKVKTEITTLLKNFYISDQDLAEGLGLPDSAAKTDIVKCLVEDVATSLTKLTEIIKKHASSIELFQWDKCVQLCGWLLLNSVDADWWFANKQQMERFVSKERKRIIGKFSLQKKEYFEVIVARNFSRSAQYTLNEEGHAIPGFTDSGNKREFSLRPYDSSEPSLDSLLLETIYRDLYPRAIKIPSKDASTVEGILAAVKTEYEQLGRLVYYLVTAEQLQILQKRTWFKQAEKELAGYLQFICCTENPNKKDSCENQEQIMRYVTKYLNSLPSIKE